MNEPTGQAVYLSYKYAGKEHKKEIPILYSQVNKAILNVYPVTDAFVYRVRTLVSDSFMIKVENEGTVYYYASMYLNEGDDFARPVKLSQLKPGINIFRLLGRDGKEISARSFFINQPFSDSLYINKVDLFCHRLA